MLSPTQFKSRSGHSCGAFVGGSYSATLISSTGNWAIGLSNSGGLTITGLDIDTEGNIYIAGSVSISYNPQAFIAKYDVAGNRLWSFTIAEFESFFALGLTSVGLCALTSDGRVSLWDAANGAFIKAITTPSMNTANLQYLTTDLDSDVVYLSGAGDTAWCWKFNLTDPSDNWKFQAQSDNADTINIGKPMPGPSGIYIPMSFYLWSDTSQTANPAAVIIPPDGITPINQSCLVTGYSDLNLSCSIESVTSSTIATSTFILTRVALTMNGGSTTGSVIPVSSSIAGTLSTNTSNQLGLTSY